MQGGGAERVAALLPNEWTARRHEVLQATFAQPSAEPKGWHLVVLGEGDEHQHLEALATQMGMSCCVSIAGTMSQWNHRAPNLTWLRSNR